MTGERKRKNPPRGAARAEPVSKKRTVTPPERSATPVVVPPPPPPPEPVVEEPRLPESIQPGNPLPTVENAQPGDLSSKEYQSIQESGVLVESLTRSRQKYINEGIFQKYWTKPVKRKGVVKEEPNNPPKESMQKIGSVIITIEPHVLEATMFGVKDNTKTAPTTNSTFRPIMQYGPPNGVMPPRPTKVAAPATPSTPSAIPGSPAQPPIQPPTQAIATPASSSQPPAQVPSSLSRPQIPRQGQPPPVETQRLTPSNAVLKSPSTAPPMATHSSVLAAPGAPQTLQNGQPFLKSPAPHTPNPRAPAGASAPSSVHQGVSRPLQAPTPNAAYPPTAPGAPTNPKPVTPSAKPATPTPAGADPIIVTLAEKASHDPHLRDLMKRVAIGQALPEELSHFQRIIDQITVEYKKNGGQQGPSADRLIVDGRTVKYFADEVRAILDIVLSSNPQQKSSDLKVPVESDPLVILLVKKSLDDHTTRNMVRRVAENKTKFSDATDLKAVLDRLKDLLPKGGPKAQQSQGPANATPEVSTNGPPSRKASVAQAPVAPTSQQALRSKGPPPSFKAEFSAIVLEFSGGTGDRYLFPKHSILEYQPGASQVLASFLIVRKGSQSEYGGDPALDYYQPMTIRLSSPSGKHLEQIARVVAPQDEVRHYMDDIMTNMTRAEYILLAMRLPRPGEEDGAEDRSQSPQVDNPQQPPQRQPQQGVLWTTKPAPVKLAPQAPTSKAIGEDEQYQNFIATVS